MKSFKEYLTESKKTYDFRIKIAGDLPEGADSMMKTALEKYGVENYKKLSKTMVQEHPLDFPQLKKRKLDQESGGEEPIEAEGSIIFDRNELLKRIANSDK